MKKIFSNDNIQNEYLKGAKILKEMVGGTLGPKGRNIILHAKGKNPIVTKDGATVAKFIDIDDDPVQNIGAQIIKQASQKTNEEAGDGTTTATVLAYSVFQHAQKYIAAGFSPIELKKGIEKATEKVVEFLSDKSRPISSKEDIEHIATISANGDNVIGKLIATAIDSVGKDGAVTVKDARSLETTVEFIEGFQLESGFMSPEFITDERMNLVRYENPYILVTDENISIIDQLMPTLEMVARSGKPLLIVAEEYSSEALAILIMNAIRNTMKITAVKAPRYGEERRDILKDLALSTGATFVTQGGKNPKSLKEVVLTDLGTAKTVEVTKSRTTVAGGNADFEGIERKIESLKAEIKQTDSLEECERIQTRITKLASAVAVIYVGAATEVELIEKKYRIEDSLEAVKSAQKEGILPGGGVALAKAHQYLKKIIKNKKFKPENDEQLQGIKILQESILEPLKQIVKNSGTSSEIVLEKVLNSKKDNWGYNAANDTYGNLFDLGIIDPAKVTKTALQNAISAASALIISKGTIVES